jgi:hypothetical protein
MLQQTGSPTAYASLCGEERLAPLLDGSPGRVWHNGATTYQTAAAQRTKWRPDHNHKATVVVRPPRTKSTKPTILLFIIYYLPFAPAVSYQTTTRHWPLAIIQSNKQKVGLTNDETVLEPK